MSKSDVKSIVNKTIDKNLTSIKDEDILPAEIMKQLEDKIPAWLQEFEADGTAVVRWTHEYLIMMEEILRLDFNFTEDDMVKIEKRIKEILPVLHQSKMEDTRLLRKADFAVAMDMVNLNKASFKAEKAGIAIPSKETVRSLNGKKK